LVFWLAFLVRSVFHTFGFCPKFYGHGKKFTVLVQNALEFPFVQKFFGLLIHMEDNVGSPLCSFTGRNLEISAAVTHPSGWLRSFLVRQGVDLYLMRHHKRRIEAKAEFSDNLV